MKIIGLNIAEDECIWFYVEFVYEVLKKLKEKLNFKLIISCMKIYRKF